MKIKVHVLYVYREELIALKNGEHTFNIRPYDNKLVNPLITLEFKSAKERDNAENQLQRSEVFA